MGFLYYAKKDAEKEVEYFEKALSLYKELAKENPEKYNEKVINTEKCLKNAQGRLAKEKK